MAYNSCHHVDENKSRGRARPTLAGRWPATREEQALPLRTGTGRWPATREEQALPLRAGAGRTSQEKKMLKMPIDPDYLLKTKDVAKIKLIDPDNLQKTKEVLFSRHNLLKINSLNRKSKLTPVARTTVVPGAVAPRQPAVLQ